MEGMPTLSVQQRAVVTGEATVRAGTVELDTADTADVVLGDVPVPDGDGVVGFDGYFHGGGWCVGGETRRGGGEWRGNGGT